MLLEFKGLQTKHPGKQLFSSLLCPQDGPCIPVLHFSLATPPAVASPAAQFTFCEEQGAGVNPATAVLAPPLCAHPLGCVLSHLERRPQSSMVVLIGYWACTWGPGGAAEVEPPAPVYEHSLTAAMTPDPMLYGTQEAQTHPCAWENYSGSHKHNLETEVTAGCWEHSGISCEEPSKGEA